MVDVFDDFAHEDGDWLLESFRQRAPAMENALTVARSRGAAVMYVNDDRHGWRSDFPALVKSALAGKGGDMIAPLGPGGEEPTLVKHRYSAFDQTRARAAARLARGRSDRSRWRRDRGLRRADGDRRTRELHLKASIDIDACATVDPELEETALRYAELVAGAFLIHLTPEGDCQRRDLSAFTTPRARL